MLIGWRQRLNMSNQSPRRITCAESVEWKAIGLMTASMPWRVNDEVYLVQRSYTSKRFDCSHLSFVRRAYDSNGFVYSKWRKEGSEGMRFCICGTRISSSANISRPRCGRCCRLERERKWCTGSSNVPAVTWWVCQPGAHESQDYRARTVLDFGKSITVEMNCSLMRVHGIVQVVILLIQFVEGYLDGVLLLNNSRGT